MSGDKRPVTITNFEGAEEILARSNYGGIQYVVSIGEPRSRKPWPYQGVTVPKLRLEFDDVTYDKSLALRAGCTTITPPEHRHIKRLISFLRTVRGPLLCHCAAGVSRSAASAAIFLCMFLPPGEERRAMRYVRKIRTIAYPNQRMIALADKQLGRRGAMQRACADVFGQPFIDVTD